MANEADPVRLFVSYSWTTPAHEAWVLNLATKLTERGVHVILDKWDLAEGQDASAFMERMITDVTVTKVVMICDKMYAEKANNRTSGVGLEAQIMSPHIYASSDQTKFVALLREKDRIGRPYLPAYYGNRIYIDFSDDRWYADRLEQLERWIAGKPRYVRPPLGQRPWYLGSSHDVQQRPKLVVAKKAEAESIKGKTMLSERRSRFPKP